MYSLYLQQELEEKKEALSAAEKDFKRYLEDFGMMRPAVNQASTRPGIQLNVHLLACNILSSIWALGFVLFAGRTQMVTLAQTQKEQSRLEKVLLQQQKEIRNLQRGQELSKAGILTAT